MTDEYLYKISSQYQYQQSKSAGNALLETESESAPAFLAESESISVSWDQAQVCPTQYEKCETSRYQLFNPRPTGGGGGLFRARL